MIRRCGTLVFVGVGLMGGWLVPAGAQDLPDPTTCFDLDVGPWERLEGSQFPVDRPWSDPPDVAADSTGYLLPSRVRFSPDETVGPWKGREVVIPENTLSVPRPYRYWDTSGDTVVFTFNDGFWGTEGKVLRDGSAWGGTVETQTDYAGAGRYHRPVRLDPVDCTSEPPEPAALDPVAIREWVTKDGERLALGEPVPETWLVDLPPSRAISLPLELDGLWAGHRELSGRISSDGRLSAVEIGYPLGYDPAELIRQTSAGLNGLPSTEDISAFLAGGGREDGRPLSLRFGNRTTRFRFSRIAGSLRVSVSDPRLPSH